MRSPEAAAPDEASAPRYRIAAAPRFAPPRAPAARLSCNGGVVRRGAAFHPRDDWRDLDAAELAGALAPAPGADDVLPASCLGLFELPKRLRREFWRRAEKGAAPDRSLGDLVELLRFKRLPLPERVALEVVASLPGRASTRASADGQRLEGLGFGAGGAPPRAPVALANLGDEATHVVLLPLPGPALRARLGEAPPAKAPGETPEAPDALARRFFERFPDEPLWRLELAPGEGVFLSPLGVVHDGWTHGKRDLDVVLRVVAEPEAPARSA